MFDQAIRVNKYGYGAVIITGSKCPYQPVAPGNGSFPGVTVVIVTIICRDGLLSAA